MKGYIRQKGKNRYEIIYDEGKDLDRKRRQRSVTVHGTKRDAERRLREILHSLEVSTYIKPHNMTVGDVLTMWLENDAMVNTSRRSYQVYRSRTRQHLIPGLGNIPVLQLTPQRVQTYLTNELMHGRKKTKGGLSAQSVAFGRGLLSKAINYAMKMGLVPRNVVKLVDPPRVERPTIKVLDVEDARRLLKEAAKTAYGVIVYTLLYTGLRLGEVLGLRWRNVDLLMAELQVEQTVYQLNDGTIEIKEPKTPHSRRRVSLSPDLALQLRDHRLEQETWYKKCGRPLTKDDFVFAQPGGRPIGPNSMTGAFKRIAARAGLPDMRLHDLRHTHATLMLKAGIHPKVVSERLGRASVNITLDIYSHVLPGLQERAAEQFDAVMNVNVG